MALGKQLVEPLAKAGKLGDRVIDGPAESGRPSGGERFEVEVEQHHRVGDHVGRHPWSARPVTGVDEEDNRHSSPPSGAADEQDADTGAVGPQAMGKVIAALKPQMAGRADMGKVSGLVKAALS